MELKGNLVDRDAEPMHSHLAFGATQVEKAMPHRRPFAQHEGRALENLTASRQPCRTNPRQTRQITTAVAGHDVRDTESLDGIEIGPGNARGVRVNELRRKLPRNALYVPQQTSESEAPGDTLDAVAIGRCLSEASKFRQVEAVQIFMAHADDMTVDLRGQTRDGSVEPGLHKVQSRVQDAHGLGSVKI